MLNRLMFIYFIQKKGFLDGDPDYLRQRAGGEPGDAGRIASTADFLCSAVLRGLCQASRGALAPRRAGCSARCPI